MKKSKGEHRFWRNWFGQAQDAEQEPDSSPSETAIVGEEALLLEALEPRILYSAAPVEVAPAAEDTSDQLVEDVAASPITNAVDAPEIDAPEVIGNLLSSEDALTDEEAQLAVESLAQSAIQIWEVSGISEDQKEALSSVTYRISDLGGNVLGAAEGTVITIDDNAAGAGWFIDESPSEGDDLLEDRFDLLTVLLHEQGHVLGLEDTYVDADDLLYGILDEGERRLPSEGQAEGATPESLDGVHHLVAGGTAGDVSIYTGGAGESLVDTTEFINSFGTTVRESSDSHELQVGDSDIALSSGHHLVLYNVRWDDDPSANPGGDRDEIQTNLNLNGVDLAAGYSQGYIRRTGGADETVTAGGAIIDVTTDGHLLQLQSVATDTSTDEDPIREADSTGIQLIKLDDTWDYLRLSGGDVADGLVSNDGAKDLTANNFETVIYSTPGVDDEVDAGFSYNDTTGEITLNADGNYLVFANSYFSHTSTSARTSYYQSLSLDGTEIDGTRTNVYLRGSESTNDGAASFGGIISASSGQVLTVGVAPEGGSIDATLDGTKTAITIVRLPDTAQTINLSDATGQNVNEGSADPVTFTQQNEVDAAFSHTAATSEVTVNATGDYLFLNNLFHIEDTGPDSTFENQARTGILQGYSVNGGSMLDYGQTFRYNRDGSPTDEAANWSGAVIGLTSGDTVEVVTQQLAAGGTVTAEKIAFQGVSLSSLFAPEPLAVTQSSGLTVDGTTPTS
ncbi:MAG: LEPR-XLL domain-containing protein, partial [Verrucomicrobiota bacterium]